MTVSSATHPGTVIAADVRAVVFDMDGVLLDTERLWGVAEARLCARHGVAYDEEDEKATLGLLVEEACRHYARRFALPESAAPELARELTVMMCQELAANVVQPLPGAVELLDRLAGRVPLGVASNSPRVVVDRAMERSGLGRYFGAVVSVDDVARPKPHPDLYLAACAALRVPPTDALALEDSPVGARSAVAAGLRCIAVAPRDRARRMPVPSSVGSLLELVLPGERAGPEQPILRDMAEVTLEVRNPSGLHARPAALFVKAAAAFSSEVQVANVTRNPEKSTAARSLLGVLGLGVSSGHRIRISAQGEDADDAIDTLRQLVESGLGEDVAASPG